VELYLCSQYAFLAWCSVKKRHRDKFTFTFKFEEAAGGLKTSRIEEFRNLYSSLNIFMAIKPRRMRLARHVAHMGEVRNDHTILIGKAEGSKLFGRLWEENIKIEHKYIERVDVDWFYVPQNRS
jgi:hypothetical protein